MHWEQKELLNPTKELQEKKIESKLNWRPKKQNNSKKLENSNRLKKKEDCKRLADELKKQLVTKTKHLKSKSEGNNYKIKFQWRMVSQKENSGTNKARKNIRAEKTEKRNKII